MFLHQALKFFFSSILFLVTATTFAQTLSVPPTSNTGTFTITVANTYTWRVEEQSGSTWVSVGSGQGSSGSFSLTRPNGTYSYRLYNCYPVSGGCSYSSSPSIVVNITGTGGGSAPAVGVTPASPPTDSGSTTPVGSMAGSFRVDESGSANYSVPIAVPDGVAGVKPQFAITYNSQGSTGMVGVGANISGVGTVSRCHQTLLKDGVAKPITWSSEDRFCLNGQRLMLVSTGSYGDSGTIYKTELDSFIKVTAFGGVSGSPDYFEVEAKDGSKTTFGGTSDSRLLVNSKPLSWAQNRFEDSVGNRIDFVYEGDATTGQRIKYAYYAYPAAKSSSSYAARIEFTYSDRSDTSSFYLSGGKLAATKRLNSVTSYNGASIFRKYNFYYNEISYSSVDTLSRLTSAEECYSESSSSCYPRTRFDWSYKTVGFGGSTIWMNQLPAANKFKTYRFMDFNGDGRQDFVWIRGSGTTRYVEYGSINSASYGGIQSRPFAGGTNSLTYTVVDLPEAELELDVIDYNNDGRQDLAVCRSVDAGLNCASWDLYQSVPTNTGDWVLSSSKVTLPFIPKGVVFGDINADGLTDALHSGSTSSTLSLYLGKKVANAAVTSSRYYDFSATPETLTLAGTPALPQTTFPVNSPRPTDRTRTFEFKKAVLGDVNGDGKLDLLLPVITYTPPCSSYNICHTTTDGYYSDSKIMQLYTYLNNGSEFTYSTSYSIYIAATQYTDPAGLFQVASFKPVDINADGLIDIAATGGLDWEYYLNAGVGLTRSNPLFNITSSAYGTKSVEFFDYNRDGYLDVLWHDKKNSQLKVRIWDRSINKMGTSDTVLYSSKPASRDYSVGDMTGDGFEDLIEMKFDSGGNIDIGITQGLGDATTLDKIYKITDGNGKQTEIKYGALANTLHYSTMRGINSNSSVDSNYCVGWPYSVPCNPPIVFSSTPSYFYSQLNRPFGDTFEAANPAPVLELGAMGYAVIQVAGSAPTIAVPTNMNKVTYHYHRARLQAGGRGHLGFETITSVDQQTGIKTETTYHQDWPFVGMPKKTLTLTKEGYKLSEAVNTWITENDSVNARVRRVFLDKVTEISYGLLNNGAAQGNSLQTVNTDTDYDGAYGNVTKVVATISGSSNASTKTTVNEYYTSDWEKRMGRLKTTTTTTQRNSEAAVTRVASFEYYGQYETWPGMLKKETIEPGSNQQVVEYEYDLVGNKTVTRKTAYVKPGVSQTRKTTLEYDASKRYVQTTYDSLNNVVSGVLARHPVYGVPTQIRDVNGVVTTIELNADGSEKQRKDATGAWVHTKRWYCDATQCPLMPDITKLKVEKWVSGGGRAIEYMDVAGRTMRTSTLMFDGSFSHVDTEYNTRGLVARKSEPFTTAYSTSSTPWTTVNSYDILGRPLQATMPNNSVVTTSYDGYKTIKTADSTGKALKTTEEKNSLGNLVKVTDNLNGTVSYGYDVLGNLTSVTTSTASGDKTVKIQMCYDKFSRKIAMHDPDKGGFLGNATSTCAQVETYLNLAPASKLAGWWFYKYNDFGELIEQTDTKRQVASMDYDELGRIATRTEKFANGSVDTHTTWYYDRPYGTSGTYLNYQGKVSAVVTSYGITSNACSGSNYCQTYTYDTVAKGALLTDTVTYLPNNSTGYINSVKYDSIGRVDEVRDVLSGLVGGAASGTKNMYNANGYTGEVRDLATGDILQKTMSTNERGQVTRELRFNGGAGDVTHEYYPQTGLIKRTTASLAGASFAIQDITYDWDAVGNLKSRWNQSSNIGRTAKKNLQESFCYDGLNRLIKSHAGTLVGSCSLTASAQDQEYDGLGNITRKTGVGTYTYGSAAGPHAVTSTTNDGTYVYDGNGNQTSGAGRTMTYSSYDQLTKVVKGSFTSDFKYAPDRSRYEQIKTSNTGSKTTTQYLGNVERIEKIGSGVVEWKRYIAGAVYTVRTTAATCGSSVCYTLQRTDKSFIYNDHLGSLDVVVNNVGTITHTASFDAWGNRRSGETWAAGSFTPSTLTLTNYDQPITTRGFTGHEMLDDAGLIHMNGRVYDARLARFIQADSYIDGVTNTQGYNRYSYVQNNPLNATDPTGHFLVLAFMVMAKMAAVDALGTAIMVGMAAAAEAYASGASGWEAIGIGIISGVSAGLANGAFGDFSVAKFFAGCVLGGVQSKLSGGKFEHGFMAAGFGSLAGRAGGGVPGLIVSTIVGGTVSEMTGGKFKNGAKSAAFSYVVMWGAGEIGEARHERNIQEFYDSLGLDESGKPKDGTSEGWTEDGVKKILKITKIGRKFLKQMEKDPVKLIRFREAKDTYTNPDGTTEVIDLSRRLRGNYHDGTIRLNALLPNGYAVFTLYHEYQHHLGYGELEARILTEQFAIDMGAPETDSGYRTGNGKVNTAFIKSQLEPGTQLGEHYTPTVVRPRVRSYGGEENVDF